MALDVVQLFLVVIAVQVDAVLTGISGQAAVCGQSGIQIQQRDVLFQRCLTDQVIVQAHPFVVQVLFAADGGYRSLVYRDDCLCIDHSVGLAGAHGVDGVAVGLIKDIGIDVAQLVDTETEVYLGVLLQGKSLQSGIADAADGEGFVLCESEHRKAGGGEVFSAFYAV